MTDGDRCGTRRSRPLGWIAAALASSLLVVGCADPVPALSAGDELADRFAQALGEEPDSRRVIEGRNNRINRLSDTIQARWTGLELGPQPLDRIAAALEAAGLTVTFRRTEVPQGRPRTGEVDPNELEACLADGSRDVGAQVSVGRVQGGLELVAEFGGPPASSGCATLVD